MTAQAAWIATEAPAHRSPNAAIESELVAPVVAIDPALEGTFRWRSAAARMLRRTPRGFVCALDQAGTVTDAAGRDFWDVLQDFSITKPAHRGAPEPSLTWEVVDGVPDPIAA
jgi:hypothetical protein